MIQRERLVKDFEAMAQLTAPGEGINRLAFTDADWAGRQYIIDRMTDAGLSVEIDDFGNVIGYKIGKKPDLPAAAIAPPTKPTASPGLSAILIAINPASTGSIKPNAAFPIVINKAACSVIEPKFPLSFTERALISMPNESSKNAIAIKIPPPTTKGNICEIPFIKWV